jgi:hypothetical protein
LYAGQATVKATTNACSGTPPLTKDLQVISPGEYVAAAAAKWENRTIIIICNCLKEISKFLSKLTG